MSNVIDSLPATVTLDVGALLALLPGDGTERLPGDDTDGGTL